ncbi:MAG: sugar ABC transporter permease [Clostridia bacterium]|nr:sugar ABC transporter permease [Clostridia bacterium]
MSLAKTGAKTKIAWSKVLFYACIVAIPVVQFAIFYVGVNINSIILAFQNWDGLTETYEFGFGNFVKVVTDLFTDPKLIVSMKNSLILFVVGVAVGSTLALLFSYYIYKKHFGYGFFKVVLFIPNVVSAVTLAIMLRYFTTEASKAIIGIELLTNPATKLPTFIFMSVMLSFGVQTLIFSGAMSGISESITEAAVLDGITPIKELILIDIPMIFPTISVFIVSSIAQIFLNQMNVFNMYGAGAPDINIYTIGYWMYTNVLGALSTEYPYYSAFGLVLTFITIPVAFLAKYLLDKCGPSVD